MTVDRNTASEEAEAQALVDALLVERKPLYDAWQADVFSPETLRALEQLDARLQLANRRLGEAQGAEYPSNTVYFAEVGETNEGEGDDA